MDTYQYVNPYIAGSPVTGTEMFFGREDVFSFVRRNLIGQHRDTPILLYGQRRTGKTSVLSQLHRHLDPRYRCIFIDLHALSLDGEANLMWGIANSISRGLKRDHQISVGIPDRVTFFADPRSVFETVFLDAVWSALGENHLVLMLDEVVRLDEEVRAGRLERGVFDYLRYLMQHFGRLNFIFSLGSGLEEMKKDYAFLFSVALYHRISFLEPAAARALITQPVRGHYQVKADAVEKILQITSGHPYYIQLVCHCIFDRWLRSPKPTMTRADVDAVLAEAIELGSANLTYVWEDSTPEEQAMMAGMAAVMGGRRRPATVDQVREAWQKVGVSVPGGDFARATRSLTTREVLAGEQTYSFAVDLQRLWLEKHRRLDWVKEELAGAVQEWDRSAEAGPATSIPALPHEPGQGSAGGTADGQLREPPAASMSGFVARHGERTRRRRLPRRLLVVAAASALAAAITAALLIVAPGSGVPGLRPITAASAVAATHPDRLTDSLLVRPFATTDVPSGATALAAQLSSSLTSLTSTNNNTPKASGLAATVQTNFAGVGDMGVRYYVFDNASDANSYFSKGSTLAGSFPAAGISDSTRCWQSTAATQATSWRCETLSAYVVSSSWVIENGTNNGSGLESGMAYDAVRHLQSVADRSAAALPQPPGRYLTAGALMKQLLSPFPAALVPAGLSSPAVFPTTQNTTGLEQNKFIKVSFVGSGPDYTSGSIWFYVFDTAQDAQSYFGARPQPLWYGVADTPTNKVPVPPSGFSSAQQAQCNTYSAPARARPLFGASSCVVQWGNVVVWGVSWDNATSANPKPTAADTNMAITLARAGLLRVGRAV